MLAVVGLTLLASAAGLPLTQSPFTPEVLRSGNPNVIGNTCSAGAAWQSWSYVNSAFVAGGGAGCLTASSWPPTDGTALSVAPCASPPSPQQSFAFQSSGPSPSNTTVSITAVGFPTFCVNLAGYGTSAGTQAWLYTCGPDCEGNCAWEQEGQAIVNPNSGLCLDT